MADKKILSNDNGVYSGMTVDNAMSLSKYYDGAGVTKQVADMNSNDTEPQSSSDPNLPNSSKTSYSSKSKTQRNPNTGLLQKAMKDGK